MASLAPAAWGLAPPLPVRIHIICEPCGRRHTLERRIDRPCLLFVICHDCEETLLAQVREVPLLDAQTP
jgi:hypothetical protein